MLHKQGDLRSSNTDSSHNSSEKAMTHHLLREQLHLVPAERGLALGRVQCAQELLQQQAVTPLLGLWPRRPSDAALALHGLLRRGLLGGLNDAWRESAGKKAPKYYVHMQMGTGVWLRLDAARWIQNRI